MKKASLVDDYLNKYAVSSHWLLCAKSVENVERVVVIPAYDELEMLFDTLASIAGNPVSYLDTTMVVCVVNNKANASVSVRENNSKTLKVLSALIEQSDCDLSGVEQVKEDTLRTIAESGLRLGYIDACSPGFEIPEKVGGVGMARKIGMDTALRIFRTSEDRLRLILSLDADTLVQPDYLPTVQNVFERKNISTAVVGYEHQLPTNGAGRSAICAYEIFLRYWVWGLKYAGSPYAFHAIGSTIVTTNGAYLSVRGMNRREAGEDFYFLNKLAKISPVYTISDTKVYPSSRISERVPFGTGAAVGRITEDRNQGYGFYDPRVFVILKSWLKYMETSYSTDTEGILQKAKSIHEGLANFLIERKFAEIWPKIRRNVKNRKTYERQFHGWFDGFETLKLINDLTRNYFPKVGMVSALSQMMELLHIECVIPGRDDLDLKPDDQMTILKFMRKFPLSDAPSRKY